MSAAERGRATPGEVVVYTDGAARGNPGPAGAGVVVTDGAGRVLAALWEPLGETTNNVAEYRALLRGLEEAARLGARRVEVRSDSELLVRQMTGVYRVRHPGLRPLAERARELAAGFEEVRFVHVPREANAEADRLANRAIDEGVPGREGGAGAGAGGAPRAGRRGEKLF